MWTTSVLNLWVASGNRGDPRSYTFHIYGRLLVLGELSQYAIDTKIYGTHARWT